MKFKKYIDFIKSKISPSPTERILSVIDNMDFGPATIAGYPFFLSSLQIRFNWSNKQDGYQSFDGNIDENMFFDQIEIGKIKFDSVSCSSPTTTTDETWSVGNTVATMLEIWIGISPKRNMEKFLDLLEDSGIVYSEIEYRIDPKRGPKGNPIITPHADRIPGPVLLPQTRPRTFWKKDTYKYWNKSCY